MNKEFVKQWDENKLDLEEYFRKTNQLEYSNYIDIVKALFDIVINKNYKKYDTENITVIDDGDYQGTQLFFIHEDTYQPNVEEYVYTYVSYGSCSGCDTLLRISGYDEGKPDEQQVKDYMNLALHLLQRCECMGGENK